MLAWAGVAMLMATPGLAADDGAADCRGKPAAQCLADMAFAIGKTLPDQDAARWKLAEQQSKDDLRGSLGHLLADDFRPLTDIDQISHLAEVGDFAKARDLQDSQPSRAGKAQGLAVIAIAEAARGRLKAARQDLRRAQQLGRKLKGADADQLARHMALAQMELGSDALALQTASGIAEQRPRFLALFAISQRQWQLKRKDAARTSLSAAEGIPGADQLAVARQWRLYGDEEGFRRALEEAERQMANHKSDAGDRDLSAIAIDLSELGDLHKVHDRIARLPDPAWRAQALLTLANALPPPQTGDAGVLLSEVSEISARLSASPQREDLEGQLVHAYALQGDRRQAGKHLSQLKDPKHRADALIDLGGMTAPKDRAAAASLFDQAKDEILRLSDHLDQDIALRDLIWALRRAGLEDAAQQLPELIQNPLQHLLAQAQLGAWSAFDKEARTTKAGDHELQAVAAGHAIDGRTQDVLETVKRIGNPSLKAETLASSASLAATLAP